MNKIVLSVLIFLFSMNGFAQDGVKFMEGSFQEALSVAKQQKKMVFVDVCTSWCGPCRWMSEEVLQTPEAAKYFDKYFVCFKIDAEKGEGVAFAKKYDVHAYPTFLMILPDGTLRHKIVGAHIAYLYSPGGTRIEGENFVGAFYEKVFGQDFAEKRDPDGSGSVPGSWDEKRGEEFDGFFVRVVIPERKIGFPLLGGL